MKKKSQNIPKPRTVREINRFLFLFYIATPPTTLVCESPLLCVYEVTLNLFSYAFFCVCDCAQYLSPYAFFCVCDCAKSLSSFSLFAFAIEKVRQKKRPLPGSPRSGHTRTPDFTFTSINPSICIRWWPK